MLVGVRLRLFSLASEIGVRPARRAMDVHQARITVSKRRVDRWGRKACGCVSRAGRGCRTSWNCIWSSGSSRSRLPAMGSGQSGSRPSSRTRPNESRSSSPRTAVNSKRSLPMTASDTRHQFHQQTRRARHRAVADPAGRPQSNGQVERLAQSCRSPRRSQEVGLDSCVQHSHPGLLGSIGVDRKPSPKAAFNQLRFVDTFRGRPSVRQLVRLSPAVELASNPNVKVERWRTAVPRPHVVRATRPSSRRRDDAGMSAQ